PAGGLPTDAGPLPGGAGNWKQGDQGPPRTRSPPLPPVRVGCGLDMFFGFWRKKRKERKKPADPLAAFDQLIEDLERQAAEVRKSAATLLAIKGELTRSAERYTRQMADMAGRYKVAESNAEIK